ncbi:MAG TPA: T9SS type A sorting domain-containing protein [Bacteroidales bacterium]|nr:T9SS type A sorting domain-containing protein [Bacteroidales bacterium]HPJ60220.1 T9SS type A sorting domain-containing protein [Bacteroidales bacterium]HPR12265.1 T9SS type A sorting domain-containing protein [Bacteroidales bacterium]
MKQSIICAGLIFYFVCNVHGQIPGDNLIGFWSFNGNANDLSINSNHGTVNGATLVPDRFGTPARAYHFDGNDYISIPHSTTLNMQDALSFSVWIKPETLSGTRMVFGKSNYTTTTDYLLRVKSDGYIQWEYDGYTDTDSSQLKLNTWHHIVVTASAPGEIKKVYIDNQLIKETLTSSGPFGFISNPFTIGYSSRGAEYFIGTIDELRMYQKVLSESEIDALFKESCNTASFITVKACKSYKAPDGAVYTTSGIKTAVIPNAAGCDSTITIDLEINSVDTSVTRDGLTLTSNASGALYQWLDCNNGNSILPGETNQSFIVTQNGNYSVRVTQNDCVDTSSCFLVTTVGILENNFNTSILVYPNPTNGNITIDLGEMTEISSVIISDMSGKEISRSEFGKTDKFEMSLNVNPGIYLLTIKSDDITATFRLIKN